jgi:hypothetical protein
LTLVASPSEGGCQPDLDLVNRAKDNSSKSARIPPAKSNNFGQWITNPDSLITRSNMLAWALQADERSLIGAFCTHTG